MRRTLRVVAVLCLASFWSVAPAQADENGIWDRTGGPLYSGIGGVTAPELILESKVSPVYPKKGRKKQVEAQCVLQAVIRKDGGIGPLEVMECRLRFKDGMKRLDVWPRQNDEFGFAQSAYEAVKQWRYKPSTLNGEVVDVLFTVVVTYELGKPEKKSG